MIRTVWDCDRCGATDLPVVKSLYIPGPPVAGAENAVAGLTRVDLCPGCLCEGLRQAIHDQPAALRLPKAGRWLHPWAPAAGPEAPPDG
jgi:hypothetical protein